MNKTFVFALISVVFLAACRSHVDVKTPSGKKMRYYYDKDGNGPVGAKEVK